MKRAAKRLSHEKYGDLQNITDRWAVLNQSGGV